MDAGAPSVRANKKMVASVANQKLVEVSPATVDAGMSPVRASKKMAASVAAQKQLRDVQQPWMLGRPRGRKKTKEMMGRPRTCLGLTCPR